MGETMISSMDVVNNLHSKYKIADVEANSHLFVGVREISQPIFFNQFIRTDFKAHETPNKCMNDSGVE